MELLEGWMTAKTTEEITLVCRPVASVAATTSLTVLSLPVVSSPFESSPYVAADRRHATALS